MDLSSWYISGEGSLVCEGHSSVKLKILHLEDHSLFHEGMRKLIDPFLPDMEYVHIQSGIEALDQYKNSLEAGMLPDLIISDINHPGMDGIEFIRALRNAEKKYGVRTPVMILSMVDPSRYFVLVKEGLVDHCLTKAASVDEIIEGILKLLSQ